MDAHAVFEALKQLLTPYEAACNVKTDSDTTYYLDYRQAEQKAKPEMFAAVMIKKHYVSLYYMPVYREPQLLHGISPALKKRMQGKSCFNFTVADDPAISELAVLIGRTAGPMAQVHGKLSA